MKHSEDDVLNDLMRIELEIEIHTERLRNLWIRKELSGSRDDVGISLSMLESIYV